MVVFVNDKKVKFIELNQDIEFDKFNFIIRGIPEIPVQCLKGHLLVFVESYDIISKFIDLVEARPLNGLKSVTFVVQVVTEARAYFKSLFKVIKAAGGIVEKGDQILLIHRLGKWDLPKGKFEKGESEIECAKREVEEECSVEVEVGDKIGVSYHTYVRNHKRVLKKNYWYRMSIIDESQMKPQKKEGINDVRWMNKLKVEQSMETGYKSIAYLLKKKYYKS